MVNLDVKSIQRLMRSKAKSIKDLAYDMGVSPGLVKKVV